MLQFIEKPFLHAYPGMVAVVTAQYNGHINIMACGWHAWLSDDPPVYGIAVGKETYTHELIAQAKGFAVHFLSADFAETIQKAGELSGRSGDKLKALKLAADPGKTIDVPILRQAYAAYECRVIDVRSYGRHDWFAGRVTACYRDDTAFDGEGLPDWKQLSIPLYLGRSKYYIAEQTGTIKTFGNHGAAHTEGRPH
ncbi:flavin reductase family protein [Caenibacillus caldisaponilyticus]|uniref:flavin reductase family protein n=1 Tax=Caenibacillus caldisaponilyticus TaxID=1674942 RepID=UPI0009884F81|nr:flavin reductase family protein [Caenibacillus caldisaponilyticus]